MKKRAAILASMGTLLLAGCVKVVVQCPCQQHQRYQPAPVCSPEYGPSRMPEPGIIPGHTMNSIEPAAPGSIEHKLRERGKSWVRTQGKIERGAYVEDILKGRLNQPNGRGNIGKVVSVSIGEHNRPCATVDFGRGYTTGIDQGELALIKIVPEREKKKHSD